MKPDYRIGVSRYRIPNVNTQRRHRDELSIERRPFSPCENAKIDTVRIDQWLFAVRLTKTRANAADACRGGHVRVNGKPAKPSTAVTIGDHVEALIGQRQRIVDVTQVLTKRVGAAIAIECFDDHSPLPPERDSFRPMFAIRDRGTGRPTKRDRRQIDRLRGRSSSD
jgi:ribosome-associated heat shock protein Hsp15